MSTLVDDKIEDDPDDEEDKEEDQEEDHQRVLFFFSRRKGAWWCVLRVSSCRVWGQNWKVRSASSCAEPPKIASSSSEEDL